MQRGLARTTLRDQLPGTEGGALRQAFSRTQAALQLQMRIGRTGELCSVRRPALEATSSALVVEPFGEPARADGALRQCGTEGA